MRGLVLIALAGCTPVYDAQFDDRATQLEAFRTEFRPASAMVQFIAGSESRLYWVDLVGPLMVPTLHSFEPASSTQIDYAFPDPMLKLAPDTYQFSDQLVVRCNFSSITAYDATVPNRLLGTLTDDNGPKCAAEGNAVYLSEGHVIQKWIPGSAPVQVLDTQVALGPTAGTVDGFAVLGTTSVLDETSRLWRADLAHGTAVPLGNMNGTSGTIDFDARGVLFGSSKGDEYIDFMDDSSFLVGEAIADGGYSLNFKHPDLEKLQDGGGYALYANHIVYRATGGIFAYGLETKKVVDLLLDRGMGFESQPLYGDPVVTTDGTLFVQDITDAGSNLPHPLYRVDLSGRLR